MTGGKTKKKKAAVAKSDADSKDAQPMTEVKEEEEPDFDLLTPEEQQQHLQLEQIQDKAVAQDDALKEVLSPAECERYTREKQQLEQLSQAGKKEQVQAAQQALSTWLNGEVLGSDDKQAKASELIQEKFAYNQQIRRQNKINQRTRKVKREAFKKILSDEVFKAWAAANQKFLDAQASNTKRKEQQKLQRAVKTVVVEAVGEDKWQEVQKLVRLARMGEYRKLIDTKVAKEKGMKEVVLATQLVGEQEKGMLVQPLQQGVDVEHPLFQQTFQKIMAGVSEENRATLKTKVEEAALMLSRTECRVVAEKLVKLEQGSVNEELYSEEDLDSVSQYEQNVETAGSEEGKKNAILALKKFHDTMLNQDPTLKTRRKALLHERYAEIEQHFGVAIETPDPDANVIRGVSTDMTEFMTRMKAIKTAFKEFVLDADVRLNKNYSNLDKIVTTGKEGYEAEYKAALELIKEAESKFHEMCEETAAALEPVNRSGALAAQVRGTDLDPFVEQGPEELWIEADKDGNGALTFTEFKDFIEKHPLLTSFEEVEAVLDECANTPDLQELYDLYVKMDTDGDHSVSKEEFIKFVSMSCSPSFDTLINETLVNEMVNETELA